MIPVIVSADALAESKGSLESSVRRLVKQNPQSSDDIRSATARGTPVDLAMRKYLVDAFLYGAVEYGASWVPLEEPELMGFLKSEELEDFLKKYDASLAEARWLGVDDCDNLFAIPIAYSQTKEPDPEWLHRLLVCLTSDPSLDNTQQLKDAVVGLLGINDGVDLSQINSDFLKRAIQARYPSKSSYNAQQASVSAFQEALVLRMGESYPSALVDRTQKDRKDIDYYRESLALNGAHDRATQMVRGSIISSLSNCQNPELKGYIIRILDKKLQTGRRFLERCLDVMDPQNEKHLLDYPTHAELVQIVSADRASTSPIGSSTSLEFVGFLADLVHQKELAAAMGSGGMGS